MKKSAAYALGIMAISTKSGEKIYHDLRAVDNPLTTFEQYLFHRRSRNFSSRLASTMSRQAVSTKKKVERCTSPY